VFGYLLLPTATPNLGRINIRNMALTFVDWRFTGAMQECTDWQLVCTDGKKLCHSLVLSSVSTVLREARNSTRKPRVGEVVEVPFNYSTQLPDVFLQWAYKRTTSHISSMEVLIILAGLGHDLGVAGRII